MPHCSSAYEHANILAAGAEGSFAGPWWQGGAIGIVGILIGVLAKWVVDLWSEKRRHEREDRLRFASDLLKASATFLATIINQRGAHLRWRYADVEQKGKHREEIEKWNVVATEQQQTIELLAPQLASELRECMTAAIKPDDEAFSSALADFREAARKSIPSLPR